MHVTDSPHPAGTKEHAEWIRTVYIPTVTAERAKVDRLRAGAPSIGANLIRGDESTVERIVMPVTPTAGTPVGPALHDELVAETLHPWQQQFIDWGCP